MSVPEPHARILPHMAISEQGLRELEIWLLGRLNAARGGGLQYHKGTYGPHNIGDWLWVQVTDTFAIPDSTTGGAPDVTVAGMLFEGQGMFFYDDFYGALIGMSGRDWLGYLRGGQDLVYTQGGQFIRYTGGSDAIFFTGDVGAGTDPNPTVAGDFIVYTTKPLAPTVFGNILLNSGGSAELHSNAGGADNNGNAALEDDFLGIFCRIGSAVFSGTNPGVDVFSNNHPLKIRSGGGAVAIDSGGGGVTVTGDTGVTGNLSAGDVNVGGDLNMTIGSINADQSANFQLGNGKTFAIYDHLGSPLVTYTG